MNLIDITPEERLSFWAKIDRKGPNDCWLWKASLTTNGYGQLTYRGTSQRAHRFMYELLNGEIGSVDVAIDILTRMSADQVPKSANPIASK